MPPNGSFIETLIVRPDDKTYVPFKCRIAIVNDLTDFHSVYDRHNGKCNIVLDGRMTHYVDYYISALSDDVLIFTQMKVLNLYDYYSLTYSTVGVNLTHAEIITFFRSRLLLYLLGMNMSIPASVIRSVNGSTCVSVALNLISVDSPDRPDPVKASIVRRLAIDVYCGRRLKTMTPLTVVDHLAALQLNDQTAKLVDELRSTDISPLRGEMVDDGVARRSDGAVDHLAALQLNDQTAKLVDANSIRGGLQLAKGQLKI